MRRLPMLALPLLLPLLGGCLARAAYDVATLPVKAGGKVVDWTTTSQAEADRNRGRAMRRQEERDGRAWRQRCARTPDDPACRAGPRG